MTKPLLLLLFLGSLSSSPGRADETPDPCAAELKRYADLFKSNTFEGLPEAAQALDQCKRRANEQQKKEWAKPGTTWAAGLDKLPTGGWTLLNVPSDGNYAVFGSRKHATRKGSIAAVWLRHEYREAHSMNGTSYKSAVERTTFDCERIASKTVSSTLYSENNLAGTGTSYNYDDAKVAWTPAIPGTAGEFLLEWACSTTAGAQAARTQ